MSLTQKVLYLAQSAILLGQYARLFRVTPKTISYKPLVDLTFYNSIPANIAVYQLQLKPAPATDITI